MQLEQEAPNKPNFGIVVLLAGVALIAIFIAAAILVGWRAHKKNAAPYDKHPQSQLSLPILRQPDATLRATLGTWVVQSRG